MTFGVVANIASIIGFFLAIFAIFQNGYDAKKRRLIRDIRGILKNCRATKSWDDRSELKLFSWMEETTEEDLHNRSLLELRKIRKSLAKYLQVHFNMDLVEEGILTNEEAFPPKPPGLLLRILYNLTEWVERHT